jgi:hypothetical protein
MASMSREAETWRGNGILNGQLKTNINILVKALFGERGQHII